VISLTLSFIAFDLIVIGNEKEGRTFGSDALFSFNKSTH
jgi:hypothetical protein